jgi:hypothetical protein
MKKGPFAVASGPSIRVNIVNGLLLVLNDARPLFRGLLDRLAVLPEWDHDR